MTRDYTEYWSDLRASHADHPANVFRYRLIARELARVCPRVDRVIDCGCGDGSLLRTVSSAISCGELHGTDIAANVPANRPGSPILFRQMDLGAPAPADLHGQFGLVLCSEVIEHVPDDASVVRNLAALAQPGGWVVLTTQSGRIYATEQYLGHLRHYRLEDLARRMEQAGLKVQRGFHAGWPWLNLQKIAAHHLQGIVQKEIVQAEEVSWKFRAAFAVATRLYEFSSRRQGPQLFLLARKS